MIINIKGYEVIIDDEDAERVLAHSWWVSSSPETDGRVLCFSTEIKRKKIKLHRFIMGDPPGQVVDHWDGNRLNNKKTNLRACSIGENSKNIRMSLSNKSGYRGVSWSKDMEKWRATISLNGKTQHLGYFDDPERASAAYEEAAELFYGDNRRLEETA
jgi:hypothetical protein